ncbi:hypothetical protein [Thioclava sp.]|uniref:hypothetical protein n=1 Tax=Thioclava sp. TaxID=1933450 RepID=UPI003AA915A6
MEGFLGDPAWVHLANEHLSQLIRQITLTPDPENPKHLNAEIIIDLADLLCVAGQSYLPQERFRHHQQITVKLGALPPLAFAIHPRSIFGQMKAKAARVCAFTLS